MTVLIATVTLTAICGLQTDPPKGFTRLEWKKPKELERVQRFAFAYGKVKLPTLEEEVWISVGTFEQDGARWTVCLDVDFDNRTDDDAPVITGLPTTGEHRATRRYAKGSWLVGDKRIAWKFEFLDQFFGLTGELQRDRIVSVKVTKG